MRARWGLAGLLAFEAVLAAYTLAYASYAFAAMALVAAGALAWAWWAHARTGDVPRGALGVLAAVTLLRALAQTPLSGPFPLGVLPTYLVPLGFALLLWRRVPAAWGIGLVAVARSWFVAWYFLRDVPTLVLANAVGAVGAWLWLADAARPPQPAPAEAGAPSE